MWKKLFALLIVAASAGCVAVPAPEPYPLQEFAVATGGDTLVVSNLSSEPIYYAVLEEEFSARARWAPCVPPAQCPRVEAGQGARVPVRQHHRLPAGCAQGDGLLVPHGGGAPR